MNKVRIEKEGNSGRTKILERDSSRSIGSSLTSGNSSVTSSPPVPVQIEYMGGNEDIEKMPLFGPPSHARGYLGEVNAAHAFGRKYGMENVIIAPKDLVNQGGIDLIVYDPEQDRVLYIDNKATAKDHIGDATALTKNFDKNKTKARAAIASMLYIDPKLKDKVLNAMDQNREARVISTEYGNGESLGPKLRNVGAYIEDLEFDSKSRDSTSAPKGVRATLYSEEPGMADRPKQPYVSNSELYDGEFVNGKMVFRAAMVEQVGGIVQNLFNDWFKNYMTQQLNNLPMPQWDRRLASKYWMDPSTSASFNVIHMFNQDLPRFGEELKAQQRDFIAKQYEELFRTLGGDEDPEVRFMEVGMIRERVNGHISKLLTVRDNLTAALNFEDQALDAAKAAEDLRWGIDGAQPHIIRSEIFGLKDTQNMIHNLAFYAAFLRHGFKNIRALLVTVDALIDEAMEVNKQLGDTSYGQFFQVLKKKHQSQKNPAPKSEP